MEEQKKNTINIKDHTNRKQISLKMEHQKKSLKIKALFLFYFFSLPGSGGSIFVTMLTLAGIVTADLKVILSTTDADFVVKIIDVFPDDFKYVSGPYPMGGYQMLVRGEIMRGRFRNSFEKPEAFKPGKIETVKFDLPDVAHTFKKGHRLMIQVQSSWFPLADRNPQQFVNIYECDESAFRKTTVRIFHESANSSHIVLPVLKK